MSHNLDFLVTQEWIEKEGSAVMAKMHFCFSPQQIRSFAACEHAHQRQCAILLPQVQGKRETRPHGGVQVCEFVGFLSAAVVVCFFVVLPMWRHCIRSTERVREGNGGHIDIKLKWNSTAQLKTENVENGTSVWRSITVRSTASVVHG